MEGIVRITPDKEKAKSIMKMVETSLDMIISINSKKFPSNIVKEYYEVLRELASVVLLLDGFKTTGEGAHKRLIEYLASNYNQLTEYDVSLLEELRTVRNKIAYEGFFVTEDYLKRNKAAMLEIIKKLKDIILAKLKT